jgi:hypothetical protein
MARFVLWLLGFREVTMHTFGSKLRNRCLAPADVRGGKLFAGSTVGKNLAAAGLFASEAQCFNK